MAENEPLMQFSKGLVGNSARLPLWMYIADRNTDPPTAFSQYDVMQEIEGNPTSLYHELNRLESLDLILRIPQPSSTRARIWYMTANPTFWSAVHQLTDAVQGIIDAGTSSSR